MLAERFDGARLQVWRKIEDYQTRRAAVRLVSVLNVVEGGIQVEKNVTVSGQGNIVNVAEFMSGLTNTVTQNLTQSNAPAEIRELVNKLTQQIGRSRRKSILRGRSRWEATSKL
jgi:hypothetical protein